MMRIFHGATWRHQAKQAYGGGINGATRVRSRRHVEASTSRISWASGVISNAHGAGSFRSCRFGRALFSLRVHTTCCLRRLFAHVKHRLLT